MDKVSEMISFFNIFKETAVNNIGIIRGFRNWVAKMDFTIEGNDLIVRIPYVLYKRGTPEIISHSRRKKEIDEIMGKKNYTYIEVIIKMTADKYAAIKNKRVTSIRKENSLW